MADHRIEDAALRRLFTHAQEAGRYGAFDWDLVTNEIVWSDRFFLLFGYAPDELEHSWAGFQSCIHPDDLEQVQKAAEEVIRTGVHPDVHYRMIRGDGAVRQMVSRGTMIFSPDGDPVRMIGFIQDVTEERERERELARHARLLEDAQRLGQMGSWSLDVESGALTWSRETYRILGVPEGTPVSTETWLRTVAERDRPRAARLIDDALGKKRPYDVELELASTGEGPGRFVRTVGWIETEGDRVVRLYGMVQDTTEARHQWQESLRLDRLEKLGHLAGGLAHDLNNFLTSAALGISFALENEIDPEDRDALEDAAAGVRAAQRVTAQLLAFAKGQSSEPKPLDLAALVSETVSFTLRGRATARRVEIDPDLPRLVVDRSQMEQLVSNLTLNAVQAAGDEGQVAIRARLGSGGVILEVEDDGPGVPPELQGSIFEPYVSGKRTGTGLGLAMCRAVVERHGGRIDVSSGSGRTVFRVVLPLPRGTDDLPAPVEVETGDLVDREVLVYDDDPYVRNAFVLGLRRLGCQVRAVGTESELWAALDDGIPDVVVLDMTVPSGRGGRDLARPLRERAPDVGLVMTSGYADAGVADWREMGFDAFLPKPFDLAHLKEAVGHAVLRASSPSQPDERSG